MADTVEAVTGSRLSILIFHRVLSEPDPLFPGEVDARRFERLCAMLARDYNVLTLGDAVRRWAGAGLPARSLVITFDDGYADNAEIALPILRRYGLRATFFVASGFLDGGRMWNDTVIEALRRTRLTEIDATELKLGRMSLRNVVERRRAVDTVLRQIKYLSPPARAAATEALMSAAGSPVLPQDLMMRSEQVSAMHASGMEIGAHTVNHPILCSLDGMDAREEIVQGRKDLERLIDAPVEVFAYPNGGPDRDYDRSHVRLVKEAGFVAAVSTSVGVAREGADIYQLPRFTPWDVDDDRWAMRLSWSRLRAPGGRCASSLS